MNNTFSVEQISKTGNLDSNSIDRQFKLDLMTRSMNIKSLNPNSRQNQIAKELGRSTSTAQQHRHDIKMLSPYRIPSNKHKRKQETSNREHDPERPQLTSKEASPNFETVKPNTSKKSKLKDDIRFKYEPR